jgi:hypothetical protein
LDDLLILVGNFYYFLHNFSIKEGSKLDEKFLDIRILERERKKFILGGGERRNEKEEKSKVGRNFYSFYYFFSEFYRLIYNFLSFMEE